MSRKKKRKGKIKIRNHVITDKSDSLRLTTPQRRRSINRRTPAASFLRTFFARTFAQDSHNRRRQSNPRVCARVRARVYAYVYECVYECVCVRIYLLAALFHAAREPRAAGSSPSRNFSSNRLGLEISCDMYNLVEIYKAVESLTSKAHTTGEKLRTRAIAKKR